MKYKARDFADIWDFFGATRISPSIAKRVANRANELKGDVCQERSESKKQSQNNKPNSLEESHPDQLRLPV